jgi:hypothetical protein
MRANRGLLGASGARLAAGGAEHFAGAGVEATNNDKEPETMNDPEGIKRKLRAILSKAEEGSGTTEAEAASALAFARRLMLAHQLDPEDLSASERSPEEVAADTEYGAAHASCAGASVSAWEAHLSMLIADLIGTVRLYRDHPGVARSTGGAVRTDPRTGAPLEGARLRYYGPAEDVRDAVMLFEEWATLIAALARLRHGGALRGDGRAFAGGFVRGLADRF